MARLLNPNYIRRTMQKAVLRGLEVVYLTGDPFGVSTSRPGVPDEYETLIHTPKRHLAIPANYRGWSEPSKLYCRKCWGTLLGIPRDILLANKCGSCGQTLYRDDDARFDQLGYDLYHDRVTALMPRAYLCSASNGSCGKSGCRFLVLKTKWMSNLARD